MTQLLRKPVATQVVATPSAKKSKTVKTMTTSKSISPKNEDRKRVQEDQSLTKKKKREVPGTDTGTIAPGNTKKGKTENLDAKTAVAVVKAITEKKDLKYIYPEDADTLDKRKKFRADVRRKIAAAEKEVAKLQASKLKEDKELLETKIKAYNKYLRRVLVHSQP